MAGNAARPTEADQRAAIATLRKRMNAGLLTTEGLHEMTRAVWASNTPHELYRRTHGLLGERHRRDRRDWTRVTLFWLAVLVVVGLLTWITALAAADGLFTGNT